MPKQKAKRKTKSKPNLCELWLRIQCNNKECKTSQKYNWFWIPAQNLPSSVKCNLCGGKVKRKELKEYCRRKKANLDFLEE